MSDEKLWAVESVLNDLMELNCKFITQIGGLERSMMLMDHKFNQIIKDIKNLRDENIKLKEK